MSHRITSSRIAKITAAILFVFFVLPSPVMAQEGEPVDPNFTITKEDLNTASQSKEACLEFRNKIWNQTGGGFKAVWPATFGINWWAFLTRVGAGAEVTAQEADGGKDVKCFIVDPSYSDFPIIVNGTSVYLIGVDKQPVGSKHLTDLINAGNGVKASELVKAKMDDYNQRNEAGKISQIIGWILNAIFSAVNYFLMYLTALAGKIFSTAVEVTTQAGMPAIVEVGWGIVRDFSNMFFILIMIVIALAAILRLEEYDYRHLLGEVVLMAILVNFSKVIAVTLIDFINIITSIFAVQGFGEILGFMAKVTLSDLAALPDGGWMSGFVQGLSKLIFSLVALVTFIALAVMFMLRLIGLYVLVIFSPLAYVLDILPATKQFAHEWWHKFIHYLIWAPVAMFMIRLTILAADTGSLTSEGVGADSMFKYFMLAGFMWAAVIVAEHAGMVGGHAFMHAMHKAGHWMGHRAMHYAGRKYNEWSTHKFATPQEGKPLTNAQRWKFALVNPVAAFKGWSKRGEKLAHHAQELAAARGEEWANVVMAGATLPEAQFVERKHTNEMLKSLIAMKKEQLADIMVKFENVKGHEGEVMRNAAVTAMLANGYTDDALRMKHFAEKYGEIRDKVDEEGNVIYETNEDGSFKLDADGNKIPEKQLVTYSPEIINRFLYDYMSGPKDDHGHGHMSEQSMRILAEDAENFGKQTHHPEVMGHAVYDPEVGGFVNTMRKGDKMIPTVSGKAVKEVIDGTADGKWSMRELATGEWKKDGGRGTINTATHGMQPQTFEIKTEVDANGNVTSYSFVDQGTMLAQTFRWGSPNATPGSEQFYADIMKIVGSPQGMREVQHAQQRLREGLLASKVDELGTLILKDKSDIAKIKRNITHANDLMRALYGQMIGVAADSRKEIPNIRYRFEHEEKGTEHNLAFSDTKDGKKGKWDEGELERLRTKVK